MKRSQPAIEVYNLHRFFGTTRAVDDVSFQVHPGEVFGFIGPNGAGKTTTMRILATLDQPSFGNAYIAGFSVVEEPEQARLRLGFMPDYFNTYPYVNVWEYLDFFARAYGLRGARRHQAVQEVMEFTGLISLAEKPTRALSKGMKQRLCLARALIHDPDVLILDEPAAGLDPRARVELRQMIRHLANQGKAVLISSHILTELGEICDSVGIIEQGRLKAAGPLELIRQRINQYSVLQLEVLSDPQQALGLLQQHELVGEVHLRNQHVLWAQFRGDKVQRAQLLSYLVNQGVKVAEFSAQEGSLEEVFLSLTQGQVQ